MSISHVISREAMLFLQSVAAGGALWCFYDCLIIFRKVIRHNIHVINAEDFFYWILAGICVCYLMFRSNEGIIRGFSMAGMFLGAFFYHETVSQTFVKVMSFVFLSLKKGIKKIMKIFCKPFFELGRWAEKRKSEMKKKKCRMREE